jgi:hypothetical protein
MWLSKERRMGGRWVEQGRNVGRRLLYSLWPLALKVNHDTQKLKKKHDHQGVKEIRGNKENKTRTATETRLYDKPQMPRRKV